MSTRRTARVAVLTAALVGAAIAMPTAANAGGCGFYSCGTGNGTTSSGGSGDGTISAGAGVTITVHSTGAGSGRTVAATPVGSYPPPPCWWSPIFNQSDFDAISADQGPQGPNAGEPGTQQLNQEGNAAIKQNQELDKTRKGTYFALTMPGSSTGACNIQYNQAFPLLFVPFGQPIPGGTGIQTQDLAQLAYNRMRVTAPEVSYQPPAANQVVNLSTWVNYAAPLQQVKVTAQVDQYANWATTTATPDSLQIEAVIPDGSANPALDPDASPQTCTYQFSGGAGDYSVAASKKAGCNVMFRHVTGAGGHAAALFAKITWKVAWAGYGGVGGNLPDVYSYTTTPVNISEVQTVVVPNSKG